MKTFPLDRYQSMPFHENDYALLVIQQPTLNEALNQELCTIPVLQVEEAVLPPIT